MENEYRLGKYAFETKEAYELALKDFEYGKQFMGELNLSKPEKAKELYDRLNQSDTVMRSIVGEEFKDRLVEVFVANEVKQKKLWLDTKVAKGHRFSWLHPLLQYKTWVKPCSDSFLLTGYWIGFFVCTVFTVLTALKVPLGITRYLIAAELIYSIFVLISHFITKMKRQSQIAKEFNLVLMSGLLLCVYLWITVISS